MYKILNNQDVCWAQLKQSSKNSGYLSWAIVAAGMSICTMTPSGNCSTFQLLLQKASNFTFPSVKYRDNNATHPEGLVGSYLWILKAQVHQVRQV